MTNAVNVVPSVETESIEEGDKGKNTIRDRILHVLSVYPFLSISMIQVGIGTSFPSSIWGPVLDDLLDEGVVSRRNVYVKSPSGRDQMCKVYHLAKNEYTYNG